MLVVDDHEVVVPIDQLFTAEAGPKAPQACDYKKKQADRRHVVRSRRLGFRCDGCGPGGFS